MNETMALQIGYDISANLARILILLVDHQVVTVRMIEDEHKLSKDARVALHRLRRRLDGHQVVIKSQRDLGYWVEGPSRAIVRAMMQPAPVAATAPPTAQAA